MVAAGILEDPWTPHIGVLGSGVVRVRKMGCGLVVGILGWEVRWGWRELGSRSTLICVKRNYELGVFG